MKALKCKPSAQFAYNYTIIMINVLSRCSNIISHRSSVFEGRYIDHPSSKVDTSIIDPLWSTHRSSIFESRHFDLRRLTHRSSIFEGRHIDLRRSKAETSHRHSVTEYCPQWRSMVIPKIPRGTIDVCIGGRNGVANTASAVPNSYQGRLSRANVST